VSSIPEGLGELRLGDLATFLAIRRAGSITGAARELGVTPSQVSKAVSRLETTLHVQLLSRGSRGVGLSDSGLRALPHVEAAVTRLVAIGSAQHEASDLTIAGPSFLLAAFLPVIAAGLHDPHVRGLELPPALLRAYSGEDFFDMCLIHKTTARLPASWSSVSVGELRQGLFASPALAKRLGPMPVSVDRIKEIPFISPVYFADGQLIPADDDCPLVRTDRVVGHQVFTIVLALELASQSEQLVFGPRIAAHRQLAEGSIVEIPVRGWDVRSPLFLACSGDRVLARVRNAVADAVRGALALAEAA
jgi:DNA-binding transcriptional LysR family regulator